CALPIWGLTFRETRHLEVDCLEEHGPQVDERWNRAWYKCAEVGVRDRQDEHRKEIDCTKEQWERAQGHGGSAHCHEGFPEDIANCEEGCGEEDREEDGRKEDCREDRCQEGRREEGCGEEDGGKEDGGKEDGREEDCGEEDCGE